MYLYYLIGYKLVNKEIHKIKSTIKDFESAQSIFEKLPSSIVQQVSLKKDSNKSIDNFYVNKIFVKEQGSIQSATYAVISILICLRVQIQ